VSAFGVLRQPGQVLRHGLVAAHVDEQSVDAVVDHLVHPAAPCRDDRSTGGHRLEHRVRDALAQTGQQEDVGRVEFGADGLLVPGTEQGGPVPESQFADQEGELVPLVPLTHDPVGDVDAAIPGAGDGPEPVVEPLLPVEPSDRQHTQWTAVGRFPAAQRCEVRHRDGRPVDEDPFGGSTEPLDGATHVVGDAVDQVGALEGLAQLRRPSRVHQWLDLLGRTPAAQADSRAAAAQDVHGLRIGDGDPGELEVHPVGVHGGDRRLDQRRHRRPEGARSGAPESPGHATPGPTGARLERPRRGPPREESADLEAGRGRVTHDGRSDPDVHAGVPEPHQFPADERL
jgi:hypothetical protein